MEKIKTYIESNKDRFLEELFGLIRIPSISSLSAHKPDMQKAAEYWRDHILKAGATRQRCFLPTEILWFMAKKNYRSVIAYRFSLWPLRRDAC